MHPKLLVFASGTKDGGGSGFENLARSTALDADIVAVVSQYEQGGVYHRAEKLGIPFIHFAGPYDAEGYSSILQKTAIDVRELWAALSGWTKLVRGLNPATTFNIHPALLSQLGGRFGGKGMFNHREHTAVKEALSRGEIEESGVTMHFVTDEYDRGPAFFELRVPLARDMSADDIQKAVQAAEHAWQPRITNMVVHGEIAWDGSDPAMLVTPRGYTYLPKA